MHRKKDEKQTMKNKKVKGIIIALIAVILIAAAVIIYLFIFKRHKKPTSDKKVFSWSEDKSLGFYIPFPLSFLSSLRTIGFKIAISIHYFQSVIFIFVFMFESFKSQSLF